MQAGEGGPGCEVAIAARGRFILDLEDAVRRKERDHAWGQ